jgi:hypothetical protein
MASKAKTERTLLDLLKLPGNGPACCLSSSLAISSCSGGLPPSPLLTPDSRLLYISGLQTPVQTAELPVPDGVRGT